MGWGQRAARFYANIHSARKHNEVILSDRNNGFSATFAGEHGAIHINVYAIGDEDRFQISFRSWRKSKKDRDTLLVSGLLDSDKMGEGMVEMRINDEVLEALTLIKAHKIMTKVLQQRLIDILTHD